MNYSNPCEIERIENRIRFSGHFSRNCIRIALVALHNAVENSKYQDIVLDFSRIETAFLDSMVIVCLKCANERETKKIDFDIILPVNFEMRNLFINSQWAYWITGKNKPSETQLYDHVPMIIFKSAQDQSLAVNRLLESIMRTTKTIERESLSAIEWVLGEITDNVITHSESKIGGAVQLTVFSDKIQYVVADLGVGIPKTLKRTKPNITNDKAALQFAIKEGVTRDKAIGQGNGLFGSFEISRNSGKEFYMSSGRATLQLNPSGRVAINQENLVIFGTIVSGAIGLNDPEILGKALKFDGKPYIPSDYIENQYENEDGEIQFIIKDRVESTSVRSGSEQIRQELRNLMHVSPDKNIIIDFTGLSIISSSFADEVIAKLAIDIGFCAFVNRIKFKAHNKIISSIIQRSVIQRFAANYNI